MYSATSIEIARRIAGMILLVLEYRDANAPLSMTAMIKPRYRIPVTIHTSHQTVRKL